MTIPPDKIFPTVLIGLNAGAAVICTFQRDWKMTMYWAGAAMLNYAVTWMKS
jgi:hypothetical protein